MVVTQFHWCLPTLETLVLESDEVHVWRSYLDLAASQIQALYQTLSADERSRAERFYFQQDQHRFIAARGILRAILGRYLRVESNQLRFGYGLYGKPALTGECGGEDLRFNLSHSDGLALYAVTRGREVGVDLERIRADFVDEQVAKRFFSPEEVSALQALPAHLQKEAFFNCWTRKEAYIKARGEGLSFPLDKFEVSLSPGAPAALVSTLSDPQEATRWSLHHLFPGPGYVGALAVEGQSWQLKCWQRPGARSQSW